MVAEWLMVVHHTLFSPPQKMEKQSGHARLRYEHAINILTLILTNFIFPSSHQTNQMTE